MSEALKLISLILLLIPVWLLSVAMQTVSLIVFTVTWVVMTLLGKEFKYANAKKNKNRPKFL
jgi:thiol:disulfide interchange protein